RYFCNGADSFYYRAFDGLRNSDPVLVTVTIDPVDDPPIASDDQYVVNPGGSLDVPAPGVLGNDWDVDGPIITAILVSGPSHGTLVLNADGSFTYTPDSDYHGSDSFQYAASDGDLAGQAMTCIIVNQAPAPQN